jgi:hypothetical protein
VIFTTTRRAVYAEVLKLKRTLAFRMIFIAPLLVTLLGLFVQFTQLSRGRGATANNLWDSLSRESFAIWAIFLLPLLITLETALLAGIEHVEKQWKHLFALPVPRVSIFAAKYVVTQGIALLSTLVVCLLLCISGYVLTVFFPALREAGPPALGLILTRAGSCWLAAGLVLSIHLWIALRWPSFTIALGAGVAGTFFALFAASARIGKFYPWLLPVNSFNSQAPERIQAALWLGSVGGVLIAMAACIDFVRREESAPAELGKVAIAVWATALVGFVVFAMSLQQDPPRKTSVRKEPSISLEQPVARMAMRKPAPRDAIASR